MAARTIKKVPSALARRYAIDHRRTATVRGVGWPELGAVDLGNNTRVQLAEGTSPISNSKSDIAAALADALYRLRHPHLVVVNDYQTLRDSRAVLVAASPGVHHLGAVGKRPPVNAGVACAIARGVAEGLSYAHRHGIRHLALDRRSIRWVEDADSVGEVRVAGVGTVELQDALTDPPAKPEPGSKSRYLAPEQRARTRADERSDVYALGGLFFELLLDQDLPANESAIDSILAPRGQRAQPDAELAGVVKRALRNDPAGRFQTMQDFLDTLNRAMPPEHLPPSEIAKAFVLDHQSRKGFWAAVVGVGAAAIIVAIVIVAIVTHSGPGPPKPSLLAQPASVTAGHTITLTGTAPSSKCSVTGTPTGTGASGSTFSAPAPVQAEHHFKIALRVPASAAPRTYSLVLRCSGDSATATRRITVLAPRVAGQVIARAQASTVRIEATGCSPNNYGSGLVLGSTKVVTSADVLRNAAVVVVRSGTVSIPVRAWSVNQSGLVTLETATPIPGVVDGVPAANRAAAGSSGVVVGFPAGRAFRSLSGTFSTPASGAPRFEFSGRHAQTLSDLLGSPVVQADGRIAGVVSGLNTDGSVALVGGPVIRATEQRDPAASQQPATCDPTYAPDIKVEVKTQLTGATAAAVVKTLARYLNGINARDWTSVNTTFTDNYRTQLNSSTPLQSGDRTTYDFSAELRSLTDVGVQYLTARMTFTSIQRADLSPSGADTCTKWTIDYAMQQQPDGSWLIDSTNAANQSC